jgi:Na+/melibiose symporter-like transporter
MYWLALTFIQTGISFYVTILMGLDKAFASLLMTVLFLLSFAFYVPVTLIARKIGKKLLLIIAFAVFSLVFIIVFFIGSLPLSGQAQGFLLVALAAFPIATFGILPNAIVADLAESDGISRGSYKAGIFFGARNLMMKLGVSVANLLFPSFLLLGRSVNNSTGVRLTAVAAFVFCLAGLFLFLAYREKSVAAVLARKEDGAAGEAD